MAKRNRIGNCVLLNGIGNFSSCEDNKDIRGIKTCFPLKSPLVILALIMWVLKSRQIRPVPLHKLSEGFKLHSRIIGHFCFIVKLIWRQTRRI